MQNNFSKEEIAKIIQWDVETWKQSLSFWDEHFEIKAGMKVLAIGEREGGLSYYFAKLGCEVICTDFRDFPEATTGIHEEGGVTENITYNYKVDVTDLSRYEDGQFDIAVFKSVIGVLTTKERQTKAVSELHRVLKKDGALLFAENLASTKLHRYLRSKFVGWDNYWRYLKWPLDLDLFHPFAKKHYKTIGFAANFGRSEKQKRILAKMDKVTRPITPKKWRYVLFGVAIK